MQLALSTAGKRSLYIAELMINNDILNNLVCQLQTLFSETTLSESRVSGDCVILSAKDVWHFSTK